MLYQMHALCMEAIQPLHQAAKTARYFQSHPLNPIANTFVGHANKAFLESFERLTAYYEEPEFGYTFVNIDGKEVRIRQDVAHSEPWYDLVRFRKSSKAGDWSDQPKVLFVAPMSGHFATLLRNHIAHFLPDHDCYVTDWRNARDVPVSEGEFGMDDYVQSIIDCIEHIGPNTHVVAVCQPGVPCLMAAGVMAMRDDPCQPASITILSAPIDPRLNPTAVNDYSNDKDLEWFETHAIYSVPSGYPGEGRKVYPGFLQLSGFLSMNLNDHIQRHYKFFKDLMKDDGDSAEAHRQFYNEYMAVMDMSAEFFLDTIHRVFIEYQLPKGEATFRGEPIDMSAVRKTALFTLEGGRDDICGPEQTHAAHDVCPSIPQTKRQKHTEENAGHYGVFNGRYFRENVGPKMKAFFKKHNASA